MENKKSLEKINKATSWFIEKINKIKRTQITRNERWLTHH